MHVKLLYKPVSEMSSIFVFFFIIFLLPVILPNILVTSFSNSRLLLARISRRICLFILPEKFLIIFNRKLCFGINQCHTYYLYFASIDWQGKYGLLQFIQVCKKLIFIRNRTYQRQSWRGTLSWTQPIRQNRNEKNCHSRRSLLSDSFLYIYSSTGSDSWFSSSV